MSDENNQDVDLFFVLRTVIDPGDLVPDDGLNEVIYLRDQPVRDVLEKLMNQQMERRAFSNVLHNVLRYVEVVHSHPYSESVLSGKYLTRNPYRQRCTTNLRVYRVWCIPDILVQAYSGMATLGMGYQPRLIHVSNTSEGASI